MKQSSHEKLTVKYQFGKPNTFHRKRKLLNLFRVEDKKSALTFFDRKNKQNPPVKFSAPNLANGKTDKAGEAVQKTWWIHIWRGLVVDKTGKHQKAIRQAIWLYLYLLLAANWKTGVLYRRISTITSDTGFNRRNVQRWLSALREKGYIETRSTGRALQISIAKWKPIIKRKSRKERTDTNG